MNTRRIGREIPSIGQLRHASDQARQRFANREPRTAFVLSGGGNQAVSQVGMLRALLERGIVPDVVVGTSAGAWNGSVLAADPTITAVDRLAEMWERLRGDVIFPGGKLARAWNLLTRDDHLFSDDGLRAVIELGATPETFAELAIPLRVIAADLESGDEIVFACGLLRPALLASAALPGLFPPVRFDGRVLVDGAVVDTVPLSHALAGPVDRVYVLNVSSELIRRTTRSPLDVLVKAFAISRKQRFELELRNVPETVEVVVLPAPADDRELFDFSNPARYVAEAYELGQRALDEADAARRRRVGLRRSWWRRTAG
ncbi:MAG TPA: patatin-like phospholipase family protein [Acidimicrobiia bacterium]|nr:patatin-like phospholipase family protein [Acidimicrobiia bacterium]